MPTSGQTMNDSSRQIEGLVFLGRPVCVLCVDVSRERMPALYPLLQQGFVLENRGDYTVKMFLSEVLHLSPDYIENRIQTVFLNGKVVDDLDSAVPADRAVLALSAAMPGLAGAVLRRNTPYGAFRPSITSRQNATLMTTSTGILFVKLFNLIARDLGPGLFERGLIFDSESIKSFFSSPPVDSAECFNRIHANGVPVTPDFPCGCRCLQDQYVMLRVVSRG